MVRESIVTYLLAVPLLVLFAAAGCSKKSTEPTTEQQAFDLVEQGWTSFSEEDYGTAAGRFEEALDLLPEYVPALQGLGWTRAFQGAFREARTRLNQARVLAATPGADTWAGGAFVYSALDDTEQTVVWAENTLVRAPEWVFIRRTSIDHRHVRFVLAYAHWLRGAYVQCSRELDRLESGVTHTTSADTLLSDLQRLAPDYQVLGPGTTY